MPVSTAELAPNIPQELIIDILLRLPAKSVGKFRCVSKPWRTLLSDPVFIKAHLTLHLHHPQKFILVSSSPGTQKSTLSTVSFNPAGSADHDGVSKKLTLLENQLTGAYTLGSCNGLVLISEMRRPYRQISSLDTMYYLTNPTTMELVGLPPNPLAPLARRSGFAFGYDRSNDDYKFVMLFGRERDHDDAYLDVFGLRSGAWRRIDVQCHRPGILKGVFLNGAVHWLVECDGSVIMAFDLSSEEFKPLPVPAHFPENCSFCHIEVLGGCLAMVTSTGHSTDVWMMMEYGVEESWTKFSVPTQYYTVPLCLLGDDDVVLHVNQKLVVYSLTGETRRDMLFTGIGDGSMHIRDVTGFCESLVSPIFYS